MGFLQKEGIRTVISDPVRNRNLKKLTPEETGVVRKAGRSAKSKSGKELLRSRGMHLERPFAHILDAGGARRTTLRGRANLNKRFKFSAAIYNLSQLMRKLPGVGTPKQWAAWGKALFWLLWRFLQEDGSGWPGIFNPNGKNIGCDWWRGGKIWTRRSSERHPPILNIAIDQQAGRAKSIIIFHAHTGFRSDLPSRKGITVRY
jgi:hypothetical protein